jgi:hypothetical protein
VSCLPLVSLKANSVGGPTDSQTPYLWASAAGVQIFIRAVNAILNFVPRTEWNVQLGEPLS